MRNSEYRRETAEERTARKAALEALRKEVEMLMFSAGGPLMVANEMKISSEALRRLLRSQSSGSLMMIAAAARRQDGKGQ